MGRGVLRPYTCVVNDPMLAISGKFPSKNVSNSIEVHPKDQKGRRMGETALGSRRQQVVAAKTGTEHVEVWQEAGRRNGESDLGR